MTGDYYVYNDVGADSRGSVGLGAFLLFLFLIFLYPVYNHPEEFGVTIGYFIASVFVIVFLSDMGNTEFLTPIAMPLLVVCLINLTSAYYYSVEGTSGLFVVVILPFMLFLACGGVMMKFFNYNSGPAVLSAIVMAGVIYYGRFMQPDSMGPVYLMRVLFIATAVKCIMELVSGLKECREKNLKLDFTAFFMNILMFLLGIVPLAVILLSGRLGGVVLLITATIAYAAVTILGNNIVKNSKADIEGSYEMLIAPLLLTLIRFFFTGGMYGNHLAAGVVGNICYGIGSVFSNIFYALTSFVLLLFDTGIPYFGVPAWISFVVFFIIEIAVVLILPGMVLNRKKKVNK